MMMKKIKESADDEASNVGCITIFLGDMILVAGLSTVMDLPFAIILTIILTPIAGPVFFFTGKGLVLLMNSDKYEPEVKWKPPAKPKELSYSEKKRIEEYYRPRPPEELDHECSWCGKAITKSDFDNYNGMCYQDFDMLDSSDD